MLRSIVIFILYSSLSLSLPVYAKELQYTSKEMQAHKDSMKIADFVPVDIDIAKVIPYDFIKVQYLKDTPVRNGIHNTTTLFTSDGYFRRPKMEDHSSDTATSSISDFYYSDTLSKLLKVDNLDFVDKKSIIAKGVLDNKWAILYVDYIYDMLGQENGGYWIAFSDNQGLSWKRYYTGLSKSCYYWFKSDDRLPLWKDSTTLQIESMLIRQITPNRDFNHQEELINSSLLVQMKISGIIQDSDSDGLTDIVENKLLLNPNNSDTDSDGIPDSKDNNPRFKSAKSSKGLLFESLIQSSSGVISIDISAPPIYAEKSKSVYGFDKTITTFIVSDDPDIQKVNLQNGHVIFLTTKEHGEIKKKYPCYLEEQNFTRMFKCDNLKYAFLIDKFFINETWHYVILKTSKGWKIKCLSVDVY